MKITVIAIVGMTAFLGVVGPAFAGCATELTAPASTTPDAVRFKPLPPACRVLGPLRIGMSRASITTALGKPDIRQSVQKRGYATMVYVYPRDLAVKLRHHPSPKLPSFGYLEVVLHNGVVVKFSFYGSAVPYSLGDIRIGEPIRKVLKEALTRPYWNRPRDNVIFVPYHVDLVVNSRSHAVTGGMVAVNESAVRHGDMPVFQWIRNPASHLIDAYRISFH